MSVIPFHTKVSSCQSSFAVKVTGLLIEQFDRSNALFCVSFNQLNVVEVNEAPVHFFSPCQFELISSLFIPRCGSVIVDLALKFTSTVRESEVLSILQDAVKNGEFGVFTVSSITGTRDTGITTTMATTPTSSSDSMLPQHIIYIFVLCFPVFQRPQRIMENPHGDASMLFLTLFYYSASKSEKKESSQWRSDNNRTLTLKQISKTLSIFETGENSFSAFLRFIHLL